MIALDVQIDGNNCWPDLVDENGKPEFVVGELIGIARLTNATTTGASSVTLRVELPDGRTILAQTTLALIDVAVMAFKAAEEADK